MLLDDLYLVAIIPSAEFNLRTVAHTAPRDFDGDKFAQAAEQPLQTLHPATHSQLLQRSAGCKGPNDP